MSEHRIYCETLAVGPVPLHGDEAHHAAKVLRLRSGDAVTLFDGAGTIASGTVSWVKARSVELNVERIWTVDRPAGPTVTLLVALPRAARQQFIFEKCTELGVARIVPTIFARSTVKPNQDSRQRWQRWAVEAGKQSGCSHLPQIDGPIDFAASMAVAESAGSKFACVPADDAAPLATLIRNLPEAGEVAVWIGPEGGLTDDEMQRLVECGARAVSLGVNILRIETAAIAVAAAFAIVAGR